MILLSSPALVTLNFYLFDGLTDQVIEKASLLYGFPNLRQLLIEYCDGITDKSIDCLLTLENPLEKIYVCTGGVTEVSEEEKLANWESKIKKNNWNLSMTIFADE